MMSYNTSPSSRSTFQAFRATTCAARSLRQLKLDLGLGNVQLVLWELQRPVRLLTKLFYVNVLQGASAAEHDGA